MKRSTYMPVTANVCRPWFQIHLTTCLVLMLAGAALVWVNLQYRTVSTAAPGFASMGVFRVAYVHLRGWPFTIYGGREDTNAWGTFNFPKDGEYWEKFPEEMPTPTYQVADGNWFPKGIAGNAIVALLVFLLAALVSEQAIRWRARRSEAA